MQTATRPTDLSEAQERFQSFKFGGGQRSDRRPLSTSISLGHARSGSSVSSLATAAPGPRPLSLSGFTFGSGSAASGHKQRPSSNASLGGGSNNAGHHHRRQSSVSTRRESADLMGMNIAHLPTETAPDVSPLGGLASDVDTIRRNALLALEGKNQSHGLSAQVEIPPMSPGGSVQVPSSGMASSLSYPLTHPFGSAHSGAHVYSSSLSSLSNKRDSKYGAALPSNDLGTLMEEDEDEEDCDAYSSPSKLSKKSSQLTLRTAALEGAVTSPTTPINASSLSPQSVTSKARRASLNLRPLALLSSADKTTTGSQTPFFSAEALVTQGLPTPTETPTEDPFTMNSSPRPVQRSGLRSLSLSASPSSGAFRAKDEIAQKVKPLLLLDGFAKETSSSPNAHPPVERSVKSVRRRSSILYKSSGSEMPLPTPDSTVEENRPAVDADVPSVPQEQAQQPIAHPVAQSQALSNSEQLFLSKSHNMLLARITDLERALKSSQRSSRKSPSAFSYASQSESLQSEETGSVDPSDESATLNSVSTPTMSPAGTSQDEMVILVADLKEERDDLRRDIEGWRVRVSNLEKQLSNMTSRLELERNESVVAREQLNMAQRDKDQFIKMIATERQRAGDLEATIKETKAQNVTLKSAKEALEASRCVMQETHQKELDALKTALDNERRANAELRKTMEASASHPVASAFAFTAPKVSARPLPVEIDDQLFTNDTTSSLPVALDERSFISSRSGASDHLAEDTGKFSLFDESSFESPGSDIYSDADEEAFNSFQNPPSLIATDTNLGSSLGSSGPSTPPARDILHQQWTFPVPGQARARQEHSSHSVRSDDDTDEFGNVRRVWKSDADSQAFFSQSLKNSFAAIDDDDEDMPPFFVPNGVGVEVEEEEEATEGESDSDDCLPDRASETELFGSAETTDGVKTFAFRDDISVMITPPSEHNTPELKAQISGEEELVNQTFPTLDGEEAAGQEADVDFVFDTHNGAFQFAPLVHSSFNSNSTHVFDPMSPSDSDSEVDIKFNSRMSPIARPRSITPTQVTRAASPISRIPGSQIPVVSVRSPPRNRVVSNSYSAGGPSPPRSDASKRPSFLPQLRTSPSQKFSAPSGSRTATNTSTDTKVFGTTRETYGAAFYRQF